MKVSIITVTLNSENTLRDTIESVKAQKYPNIEYIIIDGRSSDHTIDIISEYPDTVTKVISEPDHGLYDAMNKGFAYATGDIIGFLNSDDMFYDENAINYIAAEFEKDPTLDAVHGNLYYVRAKNTSKIIRKWKSTPYYNDAFRKGWHPAHPTFYVRRECYEKYGDFRLDLPLSADFELMMRYIEVYKIKTKNIPQILIKMRIGGATSKNILSVWHGAIQCRHAFRMNRIKYPLFYPFIRFIPKIKQFVDVL